MFGLFTPSSVKLTAEKLIRALELCRMKYGHAAKDDIERMLRDDVGRRGDFMFNGDAPSFVIDGLPGFQFGMSAIYGDRTDRELFVHGRGEYAGFLLIADGPRSSWHCSADEDGVFPTTRAARQLVSHLSAKCGIAKTPRFPGPAW
jgi:hypothetical protein